MSSKTRKTFFAVYFFIGQFRILLLKRYLVCIGTSKKRLETPLLRTKQLNFLLPPPVRYSRTSRAQSPTRRWPLCSPRTRRAWTTWPRWRSCTGAPSCTTCTSATGGTRSTWVPPRRRAPSGCQGDRSQRAFPASREPRVNLSKTTFSVLCRISDAAQ